MHKLTTFEKLSSSPVFSGLSSRGLKWENKNVQAKKLELLTTTKMETKTIGVASNSSVRAYIYITIFSKTSKILGPSLLTAEPFSTFLLRTRTPKYATFYWRREHRATRHHELIFQDFLKLNLDAVLQNSTTGKY